ncbi:unnamed protein product [Ectocarpus sp. 12 AP-2014]
MQQARSLVFGLRPPPCRTSSVLSFAQPARPWISQPASALHSCSRHHGGGGGTSSSRQAPTAADPVSRNGAIMSSTDSGSSSRRRRKRAWWGIALEGPGASSAVPRRGRPAAAAVPRRLLGHHEQQPMFLLPLSRRSMSTEVGRGGGVGEESAHGESEVEGEEGGDELLAALADELVWEGDDDEGEEDDAEEEEEAVMEGLDLESLGISMMDDEDAEEVQEQLRREWGTVSVQNEQKEYEIDTAELQSKMRQAMEVLGCQAWDVGAVLTTDKEVFRLNRQYRGMSTSTDILSFPNHDMSGSPGVLPKVRFPAEMDLGDMYISLAYVDRQIKRDMEEQAAAVAAAAAGGQEEEWWDSERGVSGAMSRVFDVQERASMLLVHGLIHLLGYDHETESDYKAMVTVEEEVLRTVFGPGTPPQ